MKNLILAVMLILSSNIFAQDHWFLSAGLDPAIISGSNFLAEDNNRVGSGSLNYLLQFGRENFEENKLGFKFGIQYEQFKKIHYASYGSFLGITFSAPTIPFTNLSAGHFWYLTAEINLIDRKGLEDSLTYNSDGLTTWGFGLNLGVRINKPDLWIFKLPFNIEFLFNIKDRPDIRANFTGNDFTFSTNDFKASVYVLATINF